MAKKKIPIDYIVKTDDGLELLIEMQQASIEEETTALLQSYIQKFVEQQVKKQGNDDESSDMDSNPNDENCEDNDEGDVK